MVINCDIHCGWQNERVRAPEVGMTHKVVTDLVRPIYGKGHYVYMDNYFSSPALFEELQYNQVGACGTLRLNRRGVPAGRWDICVHQLER